jgi:1-acyl-sn-glycerol-3-phosphate acyltransferase
MFRTIYWYAHFGVTLLTKIPDFLKANQLKTHASQKAHDDFVYAVTSEWALAQVKASGAKIDITGLENIPKDRNVVFMSNHQGNFDIALFLGCIPTQKGFIAKAETLKLPFIRDWMRHIHCVFMDRTDLRKAASAILEGIQVIEAGYSMVIFPEGTRSRNKQLGEFKAGSFKLATKPKVPIVPVTIDGSYLLMEANHNRIVPATVNITIHPPVETANLTKEQLADLPEKIKGIIASAL